MTGQKPVFRDQQITAHHFAHDVLVRCPRCGGCARMFSPTEDDPPVQRLWSLTCLRCGYSAQRSSHCCRVIDNGTTDPVRDPIFRVPVWLQGSCCGGNLLRAYNLDHLAFLESFVGATIRERSYADRAGSRYRRMSMIAKLPLWLKTAKHRDEVLRTIERLRHTVGPPAA